MTVLSDYLEDALLDHIFGKTAFTSPTNIFLALSTADPGETGGTIAEPAGGSYARKSTAASDWNAASSGSTTNANQIAFATATGSWGDISHLAAFDASSGGNMLWYVALSATKTVNSGNTLRFDAGDLSVSLAGDLSDYARDKLLDLLFNKAAFSQPSTYLVLSTADPTSAGSGLTEPDTADAYSRTLISSTKWNAATGDPSEIDNAVAIVTSTATGSWGTISHYALYDNGTTGLGNQLWQDALTTATAVGANDSLEFAIGNLAFQLA